MYCCIQCQTPVELDDVALLHRDAAGEPHPDGRAVCLGCYARETGRSLRLERHLREQAAATANEAPYS